MKLHLVTTLIVGLFATSCSKEQFRVKANNDFQHIGVESQTFAIIHEESRQQNSVLDEAIIYQEIEKQMQIRGYVESNNNADVLISVSLENNALKLLEVSKVFACKYQEIDTFSLSRKSLKNGTLLITMIDKETHKVFWMGYASDLKDRINSLKARDLKNITRAIFDNYKVTANHFLAKNN